MKSFQKRWKKAVSRAAIWRKEGGGGAAVCKDRRAPEAPLLVCCSDLMANGCHWNFRARQQDLIAQINELIFYTYASLFFFNTLPNTLLLW